MPPPISLKFWGRRSKISAVDDILERGLRHRSTAPTKHHTPRLPSSTCTTLFRAWTCLSPISPSAVARGRTTSYAGRRCFRCDTGSYHRPDFHWRLHATLGSWLAGRRPRHLHDAEMIPRSLEARPLPSLGRRLGASPFPDSKRWPAVPQRRHDWQGHAPEHGDYCRRAPPWFA